MPRILSLYGLGENDKDPFILPYAVGIISSASVLGERNWYLDCFYRVGKWANRRRGVVIVNDFEVKVKVSLPSLLGFARFCSSQPSRSCFCFTCSSVTFIDVILAHPRLRFS
jgi:hypothetical protein